MALDLELRFGMGQHGNIWMPMPIELALRDPELLSIVQTTMDRAYARALADITAIAAVVRDMAAALIEARELNEADLVEWAAVLSESTGDELANRGGMILPFPSV